MIYDTVTEIEFTAVLNAGNNMSRESIIRLSGFGSFEDVNMYIDYAVAEVRGRGVVYIQVITLKE